MNKKIFISAILSSVLLLTSCGTKPLGSFDEELQAEQTRYTENINKYFSSLDNFLEGKFKGNGKASLGFSVKEMGDFNIDLNHKSKGILEGTNFSFFTDLGLKGDFKFSEKFSQIPDLAGAKYNADFSAKLAYADKKAYFSFDKLGFDIKTLKETPLIKSGIEAIKIYIESINKNLSKKWLKIDLENVIPEEVFNDFLNSLAGNKESLKGIQKFINFALTQDIFKVEGEKTTYEGKEAYKFSIDEAKFQNYFVNLSTKFFEENKIIFNQSDLSEEQISELLEKIKENISNFKVKSSEGYLVRSSGNDVNFILKNLEVGDLEDYFKFSFEILNRELKILFSPFKDNKELAKISLNFVANSTSEFSYNGEISFREPKYNFETQTLDYSDFKTLKIDGIFKSNAKGNNLDEKYVLNLTFPFALPYQEEKEAKFKLFMEQSSVKDDSIVINEETILGKEKAMDLKEFFELLKKTFPETTETLDSIMNEYESNSGTLDDM